MRHISPLRYPGGKSCIHPFISSLIKENRLQHFSYAEPYAGGGGLALRLLLENAVDSIGLYMPSGIASFTRPIAFAIGSAM